MFNPNKMSAQEAADYLGLSYGALAKMRHQKRGPEYMRVSKGSIYYTKDQLDAYKKGKVVKPQDLYEEEDEW